jgi:hypothetical protein
MCWEGRDTFDRTLDLSEESLSQPWGFGVVPLGYCKEFLAGSR